MLGDMSVQTRTLAVQAFMLVLRRSVMALETVGARLLVDRQG